MPKCTVFSALKSFFSYCCFCFSCITLWCCTTSETCLQDRVSLVSHCWETSFHLISRQRSSPVRLKGGCYEKVGKDFGRKPQLLNSCDPSGTFQWKTHEKLHSKLQFYCNLIWMNCIIVLVEFRLTSSRRIQNSMIRKLHYLSKSSFFREVIDSGFINNAGIILRKCS